MPGAARIEDEADKVGPGRERRIERFVAVRPQILTSGVVDFRVFVSVSSFDTSSGRSSADRTVLTMSRSTRQYAWTSRLRSAADCIPWDLRIGVFGFGRKPVQSLSDDDQVETARRARNTRRLFNIESGMPPISSCALRAKPRASRRRWRTDRSSIHSGRAAAVSRAASSPRTSLVSTIPTGRPSSFAKSASAWATARRESPGRFFARRSIQELSGTCTAEPRGRMPIIVIGYRASRT